MALPVRLKQTRICYDDLLEAETFSIKQDTIRLYSSRRLYERSTPAKSGLSKIE